MKLTPSDLPKLQLSLLAALAMLVLAATGAHFAREATRNAQRTHQTLQAERNEIDGRLKRVRGEEQEIKRKSALFHELQTRGIVGEEQRLEWSELLDTIRDARRLPELNYELSPQRPLDATVAGGYAFQASRLKLNARLLHEEDLLRLLDDLRRDARALIQVKGCTLTRLPRGTQETLPPAYLQADCLIDWITVRGPAVAGKPNNR